MNLQMYAVMKLGCELPFMMALVLGLTLKGILKKERCGLD